MRKWKGDDEDVKAFVRRGTVNGPREICSHCGHVIVDVPQVGWVAPELGDSYDLCSGDTFGNHLPRRDTQHSQSRTTLARSGL
jgi:hypothetical protein